MARRIPSISSSSVATFVLRDKASAESQYDRYVRLGAEASILEFIKIGGGGAMGAKAERLLRDAYPILQRREKGKNTGYDHRIVSEAGAVAKLEQKTSGLWGDEPDDFVWQHVEPKHPWHGLLLVGIQLDGFSVWGMTRKDFDLAFAEGKITNQGNKENDSSEGTWMHYKNVKDRLTPLESEADLLAFSQSLQSV